MAHKHKEANSKATAATSQTSTRAWHVTSVAVRRRDGTHRLAQVYQLLLGWTSLSRVNEVGRNAAELVNSMKQLTQAQEQINESSNLRSGIDRAPGAGTDYQQSSSPAPTMG